MGRRLAPPPRHTPRRHDRHADRRAGHRRRRHRRRRRLGLRAARLRHDPRRPRATSPRAPRGRFHGLLHSGGRYVGQGPERRGRVHRGERRSCAAIAADCIEDTGGLFVTTPDDDPAYGDQFLAGCAKTGVPTEEIDVAEALRREPRLNPGIKRAFTVPDASIDAWKTVWALAHAAPRRAARGSCPTTACVDVLREGDAVVGARLHDERTRRGRRRSRPRFVLNASGAWAGADRRHGRHRGHRGHPRQGDHDRDEPPAREHGDQPLHDARGRRHPRPDPDRLRDRHDRHPRRGPRRARGHPGRGRADARRRRAARARLPPRPRAARLGRRAPAVPGREGRRARHARRHARARDARPPRARRRRAAS